MRLDFKGKMVWFEAEVVTPPLLEEKLSIP